MSETKTDPSKIFKKGDVLRLEVSSQFATIKVIPNGDEGNDRNFPRNLHNAAELFLKCGLVPNAVKLKECVDSLFELFQKGPTKAVRLGRACVCWDCGYCGIPEQYREAQTHPGPCKNCKGSTQVNWVEVEGPVEEKYDKKNRTVLPWAEIAAKSKEEQERELAAKRAAIEASVAAALEERKSSKHQG